MRSGRGNALGLTFDGPPLSYEPTISTMGAGHELADDDVDFGSSHGV